MMPQLWLLRMQQYTHPPHLWLKSTLALSPSIICIHHINGADDTTLAKLLQSHKMELARESNKSRPPFAVPSTTPPPLLHLHTP
jgi:hypothetical protein